MGFLRLFGSFMGGFFGVGGSFLSFGAKRIEWLVFKKMSGTLACSALKRSAARTKDRVLMRFIYRKQPNATKLMSDLHSAARSWRRMGRHNIEPMLERFP
jgi:flagellar motor component MotA